MSRLDSRAWLAWGAAASLPLLAGRHPLLIVELLAISLVVSAALVVTGFVLSTRRDLGAGLRATRRGRIGAKTWLSSPLMLAWRLHRTSVTGWAVGLILGGVVYGTTTAPVVDSFADMTSEFTEMLSAAGGGLLMGYLNMMIVIMVITTAVFEFLAVLKVRSEDTLAPLLNTVSQPVLLLSGILLPLALAPAWLRTVADWNPFSWAVDAARALFAGAPGNDNVWKALVILAVLTAAAAYWAARAFARSVR